MKNNQSFLTRYFLGIWHRQGVNSWIPLSWVYQRLSRWRKRSLQGRAQAFPIPIVVVGNITVGGTGKTPVIIALVEALAERGIKAGVISRGYGSQASSFPLNVSSDTPVTLAGDEAYLIAREAQCPVVISPERTQAANALIEQHPDIQLILSDDGLQHYALHRDLEIVIVDGKRGLGNGYCLPAGPLREPASRLKQVDAVMVNGPWQAGESLGCHYEEFAVASSEWRSVSKPDAALALQSLPWDNEQALNAVAAIGNPSRFFDSLADLGLTFSSTAFDDHHQYKAEDFKDMQGQVVLMTAKDAVKCQGFAQSNWWYLRVKAQLPPSIIELILKKIY